MAYFTNPGNFTNIIDSMVYINSVGNGLFGAAITFLIMVSIFFYIRNTEGTNNAFIASSFVSSLSAVFLMFAEVTDQFIVMIHIGILVLSVFLSRLNIN